MSHKTVFNAEQGIIETKLEGTVHFEEVRDLVADSTALAREHGCYLWLTDYSEAQPELSTIEIYDLPKLFSDAANSLNVQVFQIKRAVVVSRDHASYPFARTVSQNRGQSLELFDDIEKARSWLTNK